MKVIIPMAGLGTRMRPHTFSRPKPLINIAGQPMLKHLIDSIVELNADEYIFIVGYLGEQIEAFITENYDFKAQFVEQKELIGQAHAIYLARDYLNGPVVILFSDTLFETDLSVIHRTNADAVAFVKEVEDPSDYGVVVCNENGRVTRFIEKPEGDDMVYRDAVIGLYYVKDAQSMLRAIEKQMDRKQMTNGEFFLADAFQIMIDGGAIFKTQNVDVWLDCGKPETVLSTNRYLLGNGHDNSAEIQQSGVTIIPPVNIHPSAKLEHAIIGPDAAVGANCEVSYSIIKDSIINAGAHVRNILLDNSLIGENATVAGAYHKLNVGDKSTVDFS
jgi:glucose-1-phosphate thymidylyltransferase